MTKQRKMGKGGWGKTGRPPITNFIPAKRIIATYLHYGSASKAARVLGIHHVTVKKVLLSNGFRPEKPSGKGFDSSALEQKDTSAFAKWIKEHPGHRLPHSVKDIAEETHLSYNTVRSYLYRRRKRIKHQIETLPDLRKFDLLFVDTLRQEFESGDIKHYSYKLRPHDLRVSLLAELKDGTITEAEIENFGNYRITLLSMERKRAAEDLVRG